MKEIFDRAASDYDYYVRTFFPATFRQSIPPFHRDIWNLLQDRRYRRIAVMVFRGGGKTTLLRTFLSHRLAYGITRVAMFVSASQDHSRRSIRWIRKQIEHNTAWTSVFGLSPGVPWTDEICEIRHEILGQTAVVMALGITGQIRGFNVDDYRPDLIVVDDPCDDESTATPVQRQKTAELFFGGLEHSLAPASENPDSKIVLLQTPFHIDDLVSTCHRNPAWASRRYGCFDEDTGESVWPARFPTEVLRAEKENFRKLNQLATWYREMECQITNTEESAFRNEWLQYYDIPPSELVTFMGIDPVPPPTSVDVQKALHKRDFECIAVVGRGPGGNMFLLDYSLNRGHTPDWTVAEFFRLADRWRPRKVRVETTGYQATLKWLLEQEMRKRGRFIQVDYEDRKRSKFHLITQALSGPCAAKAFWIRRDMAEFVDQFLTFPYGNNDDVLNAVALAATAAQAMWHDPTLEVPWAVDLEPVGAEWMTAP